MFVPHQGECYNFPTFRLEKTVSLNLADVEKIAHLARLELTAEEKVTYRDQLSAILAYAEMLNELDLAEISPTVHAVSRKNVLRDDAIAPSLPIDEVFLNASHQARDQFLIQSVLDE
jgi:aspartyl-tRNA(Asn)/glutamyl-tRNA(Gln) amidotransferase subunit C